MGKNVGLTYGEFQFPAEQGFTGSAGVHQVRGYQRGGRVKKAKGGTVHDNLTREGEKMGYAYGGQVKNTSAQFKQKRHKQKTMDHGVQPAQKGRNQQEVEAGGNKRLKPGYKKGGGVCRVRMPKNVKAKGGLARAAKGGFIAGVEQYKRTGKAPKGMKITGHSRQICMPVGKAEAAQ